MLKRVYDILRAFKEYVLLAVLLTISIVLLASNDTRQIRAIRSATVATLGVMQDVVGFLPNYFNLRSENTILREQNLRLTDEVNRLREASLENARLRRLLGFRDSTGASYIASKVVGKTLLMMRNTITLNVGGQDGVRPQMPIVNERGLVGKVVAVSGSYAVGQLLINRDIRVSARVQRSRIDGIVAWEGGSSLSFRNVAKTLDVQSGDLVVTSEFSSLYPPGIRIGTVSSVREVPGSLFLSITVAPAVEFSTLEEVFVVPHLPDSARTDLEAAAGR